MIKSLFVIFLALALAVTPAFATYSSSKSMDALCKAKGFDYGIAQWQNTNHGWRQIRSIDGYDTSVAGNRWVTEYQSEPAAAGVLSNGASKAFSGAEGRLVKGKNHDGNIQLITFCGSAEEVPEFGSVLTIGLVGVLGVAMVARKRT